PVDITVKPNTFNGQWINFNQDLPYTIHRRVTNDAITAQRGQLLMLHAAGLGHQGKAIALAAPSGTGKTTAARVLGQHFAYLTDETFALTPTGTVVAHPKPLSICSDRGERIKDGLSPREAHLRLPTGNYQMHAAVILQRTETHQGPARLEKLDPIEAISQLIAQTSSLLALPTPLATLVELTCRTDGPYVLHYRDIGDAIGVLHELFAKDTTPPTIAYESFGPGQLEWHVDLQREPSVLRDKDHPRVVQHPWIDAARIGNATIVFAGTQATILQPLGASLWHEAKTPTTLAALTARAIADWGDHPEAPARVEDAVDQLIDTGVLTAVDE
ncbi:MAG: hypothetical protein Q4Q03_06100, partial [Bowdeniella nasicola]|nr:hypothetical protein [Bowdeniella nasicola]